MTFDQIVPIIVGPAAGLVISLVANWYQSKEKRVFQDIIKEKDATLIALTRESVASITTLAGLNQTNQAWQERVNNALKDIRDHLPKDE